MSETVTCTNISVVIPTHNRPDGLAKSLSSIVRQSILPKEVIVIDDGSSPTVEENIFADFPSTVTCTLLRNDIPKGGNNARNQGVIAASGNFIAFLDDDDQFKLNKIEVLSQEIAANPKADVFYHPAHIHMLNEGLSYFSKPYCFKDDENIFHTLLVQNRIGGTPMVTVRKQALLDVGLFDEEMPALQDYELWLRLAKKKCKLHLIDKALTDYEQATKKKSITKNNDAILNARMLIDEKYGKHYDDQMAKEIGIIRAKSDILRSLLNDQPLSSFKISLLSFLKFYKAYFLGSALLSLLGKNVYLKLYLKKR